MARGSKESYTGKQIRQAKHIEESAKKSGKSPARAAQIAYATVNKQDHGGKKSGSGRGTTPDHSPSRKGGQKAATSIGHAKRVEAGKKAAATRAKRNH